VKYDIVLAGVGGQGVLSLAAAIATAAMREGLALRQSEVHGMAQRGGGVSAHLRMSSSRVASDLIPRGGADMILSMEPLEALRCLPWLREGGVLVSAAEPLVNIPDYPDLEGLHAAIRSLGRSVLVQVQELAKAAGNARAANTVLVGAASPHLPIKPESLEEAIREAFAQKGRATVEANLAAFRAGRSAGAGVGGTGA
jgi:indolepyruvate ferredoxin oxidoreductase beta subunit